MIVDIKLVHPDAKLPSYGSDQAGGMDLTAVSVDYKDDKIIYDTGLVVAIPEGYFGLLLPRSSVVNKPLILGNSIGLLDGDFRGSVKLIFKRLSAGAEYAVGERIGQLIILPYPKITWRKVENLTETARGEGGFGSTGV